MSRLTHIKTWHSHLVPVHAVEALSRTLKPAENIAAAIDYRNLLPDRLRLSMVQRALEPHPRLVACDAEFHLPQPSYTWITLQHLRQAHPHRQFVLLIGSDNWHCFDRWSHPHDILAHHPIVIYPRPGWPVCAHTLPQGVSLAHTPLMDISSTEVRRRLRV